MRCGREREFWLKKGVEGIKGDGKEDGEENQQKQILCEETIMKSNTMYAN